MTGADVLGLPLFHSFFGRLDPVLIDFCERMIFPLLTRRAVGSFFFLFSVLQLCSDVPNFPASLFSLMFFSD